MIYAPTDRQCSWCGKSAPRCRELWHINRKSADGWQNICPPCLCAYSRRHYSYHRNRRRRQVRDWQYANPERMAAYAEAYKAKSKAKRAERRRLRGLA